MSGIVKIESAVPFGRAVYGLLYMKGLNLNKVVKHDTIEERYLAWETVRKQTNPFFEAGTGFEGYLVGRCSSPELALETIIGINQNILDAIARLYRFQHSFRSKLLKTLVRDASDPEMIHIWSAYLGAELGKLRAQIIQNDEAQAFHQRTDQIIRMLPPVVYHETEENITQIYTIGASYDTRLKRIAITAQALKPSQQDAWLVAENIGEFGHPLVRKFLDRAGTQNLASH